MLSKLNYYLDYLIKFIFINSKGSTLIGTSIFLNFNYSYGRRRFQDAITANATSSKEIYDYEIKKYFGLGFLFSFIPSTDAFRARVEYFSSLLTLHKSIEDKLTNNEDNSDIYAYYSQLISLTPLYFLDNFTNKFYELTATAKSNIFMIRKTNWLALLTYLPIASDIISPSRGKIREEWYKPVIHSLSNPFRLISSFLRFMHRSTDSFFELGATQGDDAATFRVILKIASAILYLPIRLMVGFIECSFDLLVLNPLYTLFIEPVQFVYEVIKQFNDPLYQEDLYISKEEYQGLTNLTDILGKDISANEITESESYHLLKFLSSENKANFQKEQHFYEKIKNHEAFSDTNNFNITSPEQKKKLILLHDDSKGLNRINGFGIFTKSIDWSQEVSSDFKNCDPTIDVLKLINQNFIDLSLVEKIEDNQNDLNFNLEL